MHLECSSKTLALYSPKYENFILGEFNVGTDNNHNYARYSSVLQ